MRLVKHLLEHKAALLITLALLLCQAACDLAIPMFTSNIVDVGIQQSGIEHVAVQDMSASTYSKIEAMLPAGDRQLLSESYDLQPDGNYKMNRQGELRMTELDELLATPMLKVHGMEVASNGALSGQQAIAAARAEYEQLGIDVAGMQMSYLVKVGLAMLGIAALGMLISILVTFVASRTGARIGHDLRCRLFSRVVSFSEAEIGRFSAASLITRGTNDIQLIQNVSIMLMRMVLYAPILAIGGIVMVMVTNASLGWVIVVAIALVFILVAVLFKITMPKFKIMQQLIDKVNLVAREVLSGMPVIRSFDRQQYEEKRFDEASLHLMRTQLFTNRAMTFMMPSMMLIMNLTSVAIVWFGALYVQAGTIQTGDLIAFITYSMVIIMGFLMLGMLAILIPRANVAASRVDEVIGCKPVVRDPDPVKQEIAGTERTKGAKIEFEHVSFCYDEGAECEDVLHDITFTAEPGKTTAIIGATGSGKSTVLKLIERFYDVTSGSVKVDGVDVRDMAQADLRFLFGYVPQKAFLFSGTVKSNVAYSDESMPASRIDTAIEVAQAQEFVSGMEDGVDSSISQGGTNVSGGQRQRLAIARAVAKDARAFLFDDSFSALDYKTDSILRRALREHMGDVTCVIVAQRIATIMSADKIVVIDEGRIVGQGTHKELLSSCEVYRQIAMSQLSEAEIAIGGDAA